MSRGRWYRALLLGIAAVGSAGAATPDPDQIVRKSVEAIQSDWAQAPKFSYLERDVEKQGPFSSHRQDLSCADDRRISL